MIKIIAQCAIKKGFQMKRISVLCTLFFFLVITNVHVMHGNTTQQVGLFKTTDPVIQGLNYRNWGSRPYEYAWVSSIVAVQGKRVIDLGVGLPSQYDWYRFVVSHLKPVFYAGIDADGRILSELITEANYEIKRMSMEQLEYPDKSFDFAYCISTFEHITYELFMKSIQEAHRVLTDGGRLLITLDEEWDKNEPMTYDNGWNTLEQSLIERGRFTRNKRSFGLPEFLDLIKDYFVLNIDDSMIDLELGIIRSKKDHKIYYSRINKDPSILNSGLRYNSCVSYAVLKKV